MFDCNNDNEACYFTLNNITFDNIMFKIDIIS